MYSRTNGVEGGNLCCLAESDLPVCEPVGEGLIPGEISVKTGSHLRLDLGAFALSHWYVRSYTVDLDSSRGLGFVAPCSPSYYYFHQVYLHISTGLSSDP